MANKGSLEDINAILGSGIGSFKEFSDIKDLAELPEATKSTLCATLFITSNWMRELLNAFVDQPDVDMQKLILIRLNRLLGLEVTLQKYMSEVTGFNVPGVTWPVNFFAGKKARGKPKVRVFFFLFFFLTIKQ